MGRAKDEMMEQLQAHHDEELAIFLGISYDELMQCDWEFDEDTSEDGMVYGQYLVFSEDSPRHILDKIEGMDGNRVEVGRFVRDED